MKRFVRLLVVLLPLALGASTTPAFAHEDEGYLALGDSVAFGFSPLISPTNPAAFVGYPEVLDEEAVNASCPGETSASLIVGTPPPDNGCAGFRSFAALHVPYTGTQLAFAVAFLHAHPSTSLVTIDIGANDLFLLLRTCGASTSCIQAGLPSVLSGLAANLAIIYASLRAAGFHGQLVAVTYYALNYSDAVGVALIGAINATVAAVTLQSGGRVADGFDAFKAAAAEAGGDTCAAGLRIQLPSGGCDIHPSPAGQEILAEAIDEVI